MVEGKTDLQKLEDKLAGQLGDLVGEVKGLKTKLTESQLANEKLKNELANLKLENAERPERSEGSERTVVLKDTELDLLNKAQKGPKYSFKLQRVHERDDFLDYFTRCQRFAQGQDLPLGQQIYLGAEHLPNSAKKKVDLFLQGTEVPQWTEEFKEIEKTPNGTRKQRDLPDLYVKHILLTEAFGEKCATRFKTEFLLSQQAENEDIGQYFNRLLDLKELLTHARDPLHQPPADEDLAERLMLTVHANHTACFMDHRHTTQHTALPTCRFLLDLYQHKEWYHQGMGLTNSAKLSPLFLTVSKPISNPSPQSSGPAAPRSAPTPKGQGTHKLSHHDKDGNFHKPDWMKSSNMSKVTTESLNEAAVTWDDINTIDFSKPIPETLNTKLASVLGIKGGLLQGNWKSLGLTKAGQTAKGDLLKSIRAALKTN